MFICSPNKFNLATLPTKKLWNVNQETRQAVIKALVSTGVFQFHHTQCGELMSMHPHQTVEVASLCDNIEVEPESGDLWLGCHIDAKKVFLFDPKDPPGSEVSPHTSFWTECEMLFNEYVNVCRLSASRTSILISQW